MPIGRLRFDEELEGPNGVIFYPADSVDFHELRVVSDPDRELEDFWYRQSSSDLGGFTSATSGINAEGLQSVPLIARMIDLNWSSFLSMSPTDHIDLLKKLTGSFEEAMDLVRYSGGRLDLPETLPGRPGLVPNSEGFSAALLYNFQEHESYIVAGRHLITAVIAGIGLELEDWAPYPTLNCGEVGNVVRRALSLYSRALEGSDNTIKFIQVMSLLEFLAMPGEYRGSDGVRQTVAIHVANTKGEYHGLSQRLKNLQSAKTPDGRQIGYRTRVVHCGERVEDILAPGERLVDLFRELDSYIHKIMDFLITKAGVPWEKVEEWRYDHKKALRL
jgi:hypothetical protein